MYRCKAINFIHLFSLKWLTLRKFNANHKHTRVGCKFAVIASHKQNTDTLSAFAGALANHTKQNTSTVAAIAEIAKHKQTSLPCVNIASHKNTQAKAYRKPQQTGLPVVNIANHKYTQNTSKTIKPSHKCKPPVQANTQAKHLNSGANASHK